MTMMTKNLPFISAAAAALAVIFYLTYSSSILSVSFDIDEADYIRSLEKDIITNAFDINTMPITVFIKLGLSKGMEKGATTELSKIGRSVDDIVVYRHFHGPFYFYYMMLGKKLFGIGEREIRSFSIVLQLLCSLVALMGCLWLSGPQAGRFPAIVAALLVLFSPALCYTVSLVSPHGMYVLLCLFSLFLMAKAIQERKEIYFFISLIFVAFAFVTLEYAFLLLFCWTASVIVVCRTDRTAFNKLSIFLLKSLGLMTAVIMALWPASFLKLSIIKGYIWVAYLVLVRYVRDNPTSMIKFWWSRIAGSPVEYGIVALGILFAMYALLRKKNLVLVPFVVYCICLFLLEARHFATVPTYMSSLIAVGYVAFGMALAHILPRQTWGQMILLMVICVLSFAYLRFSYLPRQESPRLLLRTEMKRFLSREMPGKVLVTRPMLSLVNYYFRFMKVDSYTAEECSKEQMLADIKTGVASHGDYNGIVYCGNNAEDVKAIITERYMFEPVEFTRPDWAEQWIYFRLKPKTQDAGR